MPRVSDHFVKSLIRLVRQSTPVPNTSNTRAFTAEISDMITSGFFLFSYLSFRGDAQHRTRNLEIFRCAIAHHSSRYACPGMTIANLNPDETSRAACARP